MIYLFTCIYISSYITTENNGKNANLTQDKVTSFLSGLKGSINIDVILDKKPDQKYFKVRAPGGEKVKLPIYTANDDISG